MGNIMREFLQMLKQFDVVDLSPTLENDIPRWPSKRLGTFFRQRAFATRMLIWGSKWSSNIS